MRKDLDLTILLIEHDMKVVMGFPTRWRCWTTGENCRRLATQYSA